MAAMGSIFGRKARWACGLALVGFITTLGCGQRAPAPKEESEVHILKIAMLWNGYRNAHSKKPPASVDELKAWALTLKPDQLATYKIDNVEDAFISPRDHQPYQLVKPGKTPGGMMPYLVYEKVGVKGKRMTASNMGSTREIDEAKLKEQIPDLQ